MDKLYIKGPGGRIVQAPRANTTSKTINGAPVTTINVASLKPGWSVATQAEVDALAAANKKGG